MQLYTLVYLLKDNQILLAMKKRGRGEGLWNGAGGKPEPGETIEQTMVRECQEEIGVTPLEYEKVAIQDWLLTDGQSDGQCHTYLCRQWQGEPAESEEMAPQWFDIALIPYAQMWPSDGVCLPLILNGKKANVQIVINTDNSVASANFNFTEAL